MLWRCSPLGLTKSLSPKQTPMTDGDDDGRVERSDEEVKGMRWRTSTACDSNDSVQGSPRMGSGY